MRKMIVGVLLAALMGGGSLMSGSLTSGSSLMAQTKVIAHRGHWDCEGSAQNSIAALQKAHEVGVYGSEFDVSITADGVPVVNHDDTIGGFTIETSTYEELKNLKLSNGEVLPTVEQYLIAGKKNPGTQLILEIKPHKSVVNEDRAVAAVLALVSKYQMEQQVEYISFSMNICKELRRAAPKAAVYYLKSDVAPRDLKTLGMTGLDYYYKVLQQRPEWIKQAQELGLKVNVWTVNEPETIQWFVQQGVDFITTDKPEALSSVAMKKEK